MLRTTIHILAIFYLAKLQVLENNKIENVEYKFHNVGYANVDFYENFDNKI